MARLGKREINLTTDELGRLRVDLIALRAAAFRIPEVAEAAISTPARPDGAAARVDRVHVRGED